MLLLDKLKEKISQSRPFQQYVMNRSSEGVIGIDEDDRSVILNIDKLDKSANLNSKSTAKLGERNLLSKSNIASIFTELPSINRRTFKSLAAEDQKIFKSVQQLKEFEAGKNQNGKQISNDNALIRAISPKKHKIKVRSKKKIYQEYLENRKLQHQQHLQLNEGVHNYSTLSRASESKQTYNN